MSSRHTKEDEITEIIRLSGISRSTIFRYFAGQRIRASSREGIEQAMRQMQRDAIMVDTPPVGTESREVVVSINSSTFDQFQGNSEALSGIIEEAGRQNVRIRLERDVQSNRYGMGVIVLGKHDPEEREECSLLRSESIPFVVVNRMIEEEDTSFVAADVARCAYDVCMHLVKQGCRRIVFWGEQETRVSRDKFKGYRRALEDASVPFDSSFVFPESVSLAEMFSKILAMHPRPDAFLAMDDETATMAIRLAVENGLRIPQEFAISGMNDLGSSKNIIPSLTSVRIPFRKLGKSALLALLQKIEDGDCLSVRVTIKHTLIVRDSTRRREIPWT